MRSNTILWLAFAAIAAFTACVQRVDADFYDPENHFIFEIIDNNMAVKITNYVGGKTNVRIPSRIQGLPVTVIGFGAFLGGQWQMVPGSNSMTWVYFNPIASVTIPYGIIRIEGDAFSHNHLTEITIPGSVAYMGLGAFQWNSLFTVTIDYGITHIGSTAFNQNYISYLSIPSSVTHIDMLAFMNNQLTSVAVPNSVVYIGSGAFVGNQLTHVFISNSETYINEWAFDDGVTITRY